MATAFLLLCFAILSLIVSFLFLNNKVNSQKEFKAFQNENSKAPATLVNIPAMPLVKLLIQTALYGEGRTVNFLKFVGNLGKPIVEYRFGSSNRLAFINDFKLAKEVFKQPVFNGKPTSRNVNFFSRGKYGLISQFGAEWKEQRRFCHQQLKDFGFGKHSMEVFIQNEIEELIQKWCDQKGKVFSPQKDFYLPVLNSLWAIMTGKRASADNEQLVTILNDVYDGFRQQMQIGNAILTGSQIHYSLFKFLITWCPLFTGINVYHKSIVQLRNYLKKFLKERLETLDVSQPPVDFVDAYLKEMHRTKDENSSFFDKKGEMNLMSVMTDFFIAGGDTTANMVGWSVVHLIRNPDIQEKIRNEIDTVVGTSSRPSLSNRLDCPYTEAFLMEVLRYDPISTASLPHQTTDDSNIGNFFVKKGTILFANIYNIHHDPEVWGDPHNFRPERFLSEDGKTVLRPETMCAFGFGQRRCIGEQSARDNLFLFVSSICQRLILKPNPDLKTITSLNDTKSGVHAPDKFLMVAVDRFEENHN